MIATILMYWVGSGFSIWFIRTFIYLHGIGNYLDWVELIMEKISFDKSGAITIKNSRTFFAVFDFFLHVIVGPASVVYSWQVCRKIHYLTWLEQQK